MSHSEPNFCRRDVLSRLPGFCLFCSLVLEISYFLYFGISPGPYTEGAEQLRCPHQASY
ncbi:hypothetical protein ASPCADRAFT_208517, partial [Aspergillus carbonarius ITEM 5010]